MQREPSRFLLQREFFCAAGGGVRGALGTVTERGISGSRRAGQEPSFCDSVRFFLGIKRTFREKETMTTLTNNFDAKVR